MRGNFSPARNVRSTTLPASRALSFVRTNAPPLPGLTCWNSTIRHTLPSSSMCMPFLKLLVSTCSATAADGSGAGRTCVRLSLTREEARDEFSGNCIQRHREVGHVDGARPRRPLVYVNRSRRREGDDPRPGTGHGSVVPGGCSELERRAYDLHIRLESFGRERAGVRILACSRDRSTRG